MTVTRVERRHLTILYLSMLLTIIMAVGFAIYTANETVAHKEQARREAAAASLGPVCEWLKATSAVYHETGPTTPTGKRLQVAVDDLIVRFGCLNVPTSKTSK